MLVIYRKVPLVWRTNRLEVVTMLIYGEFWFLLEVGTLMLGV